MIIQELIGKLKFQLDTSELQSFNKRFEALEKKVQHLAAMATKATQESVGKSKSLLDSHVKAFEKHLDQKVKLQQKHDDSQAKSMQRRHERELKAQDSSFLAKSRSMIQQHLREMRLIDDLENNKARQLLKMHKSGVRADARNYRRSAREQESMMGGMLASRDRYRAREQEYQQQSSTLSIQADAMREYSSIAALRKDIELLNYKFKNGRIDAESYATGLRKLHGEINSIHQAAANTSKFSFNKMARQFMTPIAGLGMAGGVVGAGYLAKSLIDSVGEIQNARAKMLMLGGNQARGDVWWNAYTSSARDIGFDMLGSANDFTDMMIASKKTLGEKRALEMFNNLSKFSMASGVTGEPFKKTMLAIKQMFSKNGIKAEEFSNQLAEANPLLGQYFYKEFAGGSAEKFMAMLGVKGKPLDPNRVSGVAMRAAADAEKSGAYAAAKSSLPNRATNLANSFTNFIDKANSSGAFAFLARILDGMATIIDDITKAIERNKPFLEKFVDMMDRLANATSFVYGIFKGFFKLLSSDFLGIAGVSGLAAFISMFIKFPAIVSTTAGRLGFVFGGLAKYFFSFAKFFVGFALSLGKNFLIFGMLEEVIRNIVSLVKDGKLDENTLFGSLYKQLKELGDGSLLKGIENSFKALFSIILDGIDRILIKLGLKAPDSKSSVDEIRDSTSSGILGRFAKNANATSDLLKNPFSSLYNLVASPVMSQAGLPTGFGNIFNIGNVEVKANNAEQFTKTIQSRAQTKGK